MFAAVCIRKTDIERDTMKRPLFFLLSLVTVVLLAACGSTQPPVEADLSAHEPSELQELSDEPVVIPQMVQDVAVELGVTVKTADFLLPGVDAAQVTLAEGESLNCSEVGEQVIRFLCSGAEQTAVLTIVDTTPPELTTRDVACYAGHIPELPEFLVDYADLSPCTVGFAAEPDFSFDGTQLVSIFAEDSSGNRTEALVSLTILHFFTEVHLEYGEELLPEQLLPDAENDGAAVSPELLQQFSCTGYTRKGEPILREMGSYAVVLARNAEGLWELISLEPILEPDPDSESENPVEAAETSPEAGSGLTDEITGPKTAEFTLIISDTTPPAVVFRSLEVDILSEITLEDFVETDSLYDINGIGSITLAGTYTVEEEGIYPVTVTVTDSLGNAVSCIQELTVLPDSTGPVFEGLTTISLPKDPESKPSYRSGVTAVDAVSGECSFTVTDVYVNYSKAGRYYLSYTAVDAAGNETTAYRTVEIIHDADDTAALLAEWSGKVGSDPISIKTYVAKNIRYNGDWGGSDPIWYGLFEKKGNCYVHAKILGELLSKAGYSNRLIWTTDKTHYWNIVNVGGTWYHIDATPGTNEAHGLMGDAERYASLSGRDWDRESWPACG